MKIINASCVLILVAVLVVSCGISKAPEGSSSPSQDRNKIIIVSAPPQINTYKIDDILTIVVQNNSEHEIAFFPDGVALSMKNGDSWNNIENIMMNSIGRQRILSPETQKDTSLMTVPVSPAISSSNPVVIRVTITGIDQSTNQKVQGYVDITLSP